MTDIALTTHTPLIEGGSRFTPLIQGGTVQNPLF